MNTACHCTIVFNQVLHFEMNEEPSVQTQMFLGCVSVSVYFRSSCLCIALSILMVKFKRVHGFLTKICGIFLQNISLQSYVKF
jgi:hypothetical protein